jgi:Pyruvate/2-oxoacid:ferredoxin oxidoreductase delta subunit
VKRKPWQVFIKPSTLEFRQQARHAPDFSAWDWVHGYVYARWPYLYIGIGTGEHWLAKVLGPPIGLILRLLPKRPTDPHSKPGIANTYHGKVIPLESARQLVTINEDVSVEDLEHVIPYPTARALILQNPDHIVALDCPCRVARAEPCLPLDVCILVGEPFASFVIDHHPGRARWITADQAVQILKDEDERGHAHHAFFKDAMLGRFYAICNCCSCCCGAMQAHRNGTPMLASSGFISRVNEDLCIGCETCIAYCPFQALSLSTDYIVQVNIDACMGCGVCIDKCPNGALSLERFPEKGIPLEIEKILEHATMDHPHSDRIQAS